VDRDLDYLPDSVEDKSIHLFGKVFFYLSTERDTLYSEWGDPNFSEKFDEHHLTYKTAELGWVKGSADQEDWAKPGKQW
jgi:hypothetical protein